MESLLTAIFVAPPTGGVAFLFTFSGWLTRQRVCKLLATHLATGDDPSKTGSALFLLFADFDADIVCSLNEVAEDFVESPSDFDENDSAGDSAN